ncbi:MAG TPA: ABC transporter ATP-binding protein [Gemmataceae bacterium]|jgi:ABC-2 type transport system ATP-binding protein|nr:ABC transporter ATP-binding protein [Gemmataceae bacterium]
MIEVRHLRHEYDKTIALENLQLTIPEGEVYGLIGPNGAGKTTLIRVLATLLEPTYGEVRIAGIDVLKEPLRVHPLIGYMSDFFSLYENMLVWEYLDHFARCYGIARQRRDRLIDEVLQLVSLDVRRDAEIKTLSRGMRQRLCFAKTLIHEPKVLLLDEPASGLDPAGRLEFRELLKQLHAMGRTVLISSHILTEMADFCTSIGIMEQGRLLASGRVEDILHQLQPALRLEIEVATNAASLVEMLKKHDGASHVDADNGKIRCRWTAGREALPELHRRIVHAGVDLITLSLKTDNLEDIYMKVSGHRTS